MTKFLKINTFIVITLIPAFILIWRLLTDNLGANPVEFLTHNTGDWTVYFLLMTLAISPLQKRYKVNWNKLYLPTHLMRRILGLAAFFYALLHLATYFIFDMSLSLEDAIIDIKDRPFILIGMLSFVILLALAVTSNAWSQRKMQQYWLKLHKGVYTLTFLGILHYALMVKADYLWPIIYMLIFAILMLMRTPVKRKIRQVNN